MPHRCACGKERDVVAEAVGWHEIHTVAESLDAFQLSSPAALRLQKVRSMWKEKGCMSCSDLEQSIQLVPGCRAVIKREDIATLTDRGEPEIFFPEQALLSPASTGMLAPSILI